MNAPCKRLRLSAAPVRLVLACVGGLVGDEQLDRWAEDGIRKVAGGREWLELVAEVRPEQMIDDGEYFRARAVVPRQRQNTRGALSPLAKDAHIGVAESVDRLELVSDEEHFALAGTRSERVDQLALQSVRVLELVDHDRAETQLFALADRRLVPQEVARTQLQVLEVEGRLAVLCLPILRGEAGQQLLEQIAVARRQLVECRLFDCTTCFFVRGAAFSAYAQVVEVEEPIGPRFRFDDGQRFLRSRAIGLAQPAVADEAARRLTGFFEPGGETWSLAELEQELAAGGAQRLEHSDEHPPEICRAVNGEQTQTLRVLVCAERVERGLERFAAQHATLAVVEHSETRIDTRREWMRAEQPVTEAVDGRNPCAIELTR